MILLLLDLIISLYNAKLDLGSWEVIKSPRFNFDTYVYCGIALYSLIFASLRIFCSETLSPDEAEQILNIREFSWGYINQAPLYSWLLYWLSQIIPINVATLTIFKYAVWFSFLFFFYKSLRLIWQEQIALAILLSLNLFTTYAHNFHQDLTQSILVTAFAGLSFYLILKLLQEQKFPYCIFLGVSLALGMLAKYNFIFFVIPVFWGLLFSRNGRRLIFHCGFIVMIFISLMIFLPHFYWEMQHGSGLIHHAVNKTCVAGNEFYNSHNLIGLFLHIVPSLILPALIIGLCFYPFIKLRDLSPTKQLFVIWGLLIVVTTLIMLIILKSQYFNIRWLCTSLFIYLIALWSLIDDKQIDNKNFALRLKIFYIVCSLLIAASVIQRSVYNFFPDLTSRPTCIHLPAKNIAKQIIELVGGEQITLLGQNRHLLVSVAEFIPNAKIIWFYPISDDYYHRTKRKFKVKVDLLGAQLASEKAMISGKLIVIEDANHKRLKQLVKIYSSVFRSMTKVETINEKSLYSNNDYKVRVYSVAL